MPFSRTQSGDNVRKGKRKADDRIKIEDDDDDEDNGTLSAEQQPPPSKRSLPSRIPSPESLKRSPPPSRASSLQQQQQQRHGANNNGGSGTSSDAEESPSPPPKSASPPEATKPSAGMPAERTLAHRKGRPVKSETEEEEAASSSPPPPCKKPEPPTPPLSKAEQMMKLMGHKPGAGLGVKGEGIREPIADSMQIKKGHKGLGWAPHGHAEAAAYGEFDESALEIKGVEETPLWLECSGEARSRFRNDIAAKQASWIVVGKVWGSRHP